MNFSDHLTLRDDGHSMNCNDVFSIHQSRLEQYNGYSQPGEILPVDGECAASNNLSSISVPTGRRAKITQRESNHTDKTLSAFPQRGFCLPRWPASRPPWLSSPPQDAPQPPIAVDGFVPPSRFLTDVETAARNLAQKLVSERRRSGQVLSSIRDNYERAHTQLRHRSQEVSGETKTCTSLHSAILKLEKAMVLSQEKWLSFDSRLESDTVPGDILVSYMDKLVPFFKQVSEDHSSCEEVERCTQLLDWAHGVLVQTASMLETYRQEQAGVASSSDGTQVGIVDESTAGWYQHRIE